MTATIATKLNTTELEIIEEALEQAQHFNVATYFMLKAKNALTLIEAAMTDPDFRKTFEARTQGVELPAWDIAEGEALLKLQDLQCRALARARSAIKGA